MPIEVLWLIPNHVVLSRAFGHVTEEEFLQSTHQTNRLMDESPVAMVHVMTDLMALESTDVGITAIKKSSELRHSKLGASLIVKPLNPNLGRLLNMFITATSFLFNFKLRFFENEAEARQFLYEQYPEIND